MAYKRRDYNFEQRLCTIADRKQAHKKPTPKPKRNRIASAFDACVQALTNHFGGRESHAK